MKSATTAWNKSALIFVHVVLSATAHAASGDLTAIVSPSSFQGTFLALTTTNAVILSGTNIVSGSTRVTVSGVEATFNATTAVWSKTQVLSPGFNHLVVQALDGSGTVLAETIEDVVLQLASSSVAGTLGSNTVWDGSLGIIRVTGNVLVPEGGNLTIAEGSVLLLNAGTSILATNSSITVRGTARKPVYFLPADGTTVWGGIIPAGTNGNLLMQHAETIAGHVQILDGATGVLEDSYLHDYTVSSPSIVSTFKPALLAMRRCRVARYYEILSQVGLNQIEDCLVEYPGGDAIDFDAAKPGSFIRNCTIRHGAAVNVDGIDLGYGPSAAPTLEVTIEGCLIYDFPFDKGVSIGEAAQNIVVRNCVIYGVDTGIAVKDSSVATLYNNTITDCGFGMHLYQKGVTPGGGHGVAYNNILWNLQTNILLDVLSTVSISNSDVGGTGIYSGAGNLNTNPLFLNATLQDYRLATNSPCLGAGTNNSDMGASYPVGSSLVDTDGDGMADQWEMSYGFDFNSAADAAFDTDRDGVNNLGEFIAGTDPIDPASVLEFLPAGFASNGLTLQFLAVGGKDYVIQFRTNMSSGDWQKFLDIPAPASNTVVTVTDTNVAGFSANFYRLGTPADQ